MKIRHEITRDHALLTEWRRDFHAHPELAANAGNLALLKVAAD